MDPLPVDIGESLLRPFRARWFFVTDPRPSLRFSLGYYVAPFQGFNPSIF